MKNETNLEKHNESQILETPKLGKIHGDFIQLIILGFLFLIFVYLSAIELNFAMMAFFSLWLGMALLYTQKERDPLSILIYEIAIFSLVCYRFASALKSEEWQKVALVVSAITFLVLAEKYRENWFAITAITVIIAAITCDLVVSTIIE